MTKLKALVSTIEPVDGGVPTMTRWVVHLLQELGVRPQLAWYAPWSSKSSLSVPLHALLSGRRPGIEIQQVFGHYPGHGLGAWLPELEFTHYLPRRSWRKLIETSDLHIAVTGNPLCAAPFSRLQIPFLAWVASPWEADRKDRVKSFSPARRILDKSLNSRVLKRLERQILRNSHGRILALSTYTANRLQAIANRPMNGVMLMPVDNATFQPSPQRTRPWRIGFSGRYGDPRKNIRLLLNSVADLVRRGYPVVACLVGENDVHQLQPLLEELQIVDCVECLPSVSQSELARILQELDIFVIPSFQEGLCIAALEAMACGVPVISTYCGGPEEYVKPGYTGALVDNDPALLASEIASICGDRVLRDQLGQGAMNWVTSNASQESSRKIFHSQLQKLYPGIVG